MNRKDLQEIQGAITTQQRKIFDGKTKRGYIHDVDIKRYEIACRVGNLAGKTVLDIGCGYGKFYKYIRCRYDKVGYIGIDTLPEVVRWNQKEYPDAAFVRGMFPNVRLAVRMVDYTFALSFFCFRHDHWKEYVTAVCSKMLDASRVGAVVTFESSLRRGKGGVRRHPAEVLQLLTDKVTPSVVLKHDYVDPANHADFAVYLYRSTEGAR